MGLWDKVRGAFGSGGADTKQATPRDVFAAEVEAVIRKTFPRASVRRLPDAYGFVVRRGEQDQSVFLDNIFQETRDLDPDQRRAHIGRFVRNLSAPDASAMTWEEVRPKLAPLLRTPTMFGCLPGMTPDKQPIQRPFAPFLIECVGVDSDDGIAYVFPHLLESWGVKLSDVFAAATENGREYFRGDVEPYDAQAPYPIWYVARSDSYESSRLLVPGWLSSFEGKVEGRPVAIVPHRSLLIVGGDGDDRCLRRLIDSAKAECEASPRRVSPALYTAGADGKVVPFSLSPGHPLAGDVAVGHLMAAIVEYQAQKQFLDEHPREDIYVAKYTAVRDNAGGAFSWSAWSKGVLTLLPETDQVALNLAPSQDDGEMIRVPWQALRDVAGDCLVKEPDLDPPRWRTKAWPDDGMIAKLRTKAIGPSGG
jgi:hypothetical protein